MNCSIKRDTGSRKSTTKRQIISIIYHIRKQPVGYFARRVPVILRVHTLDKRQDFWQCSGVNRESDFRVSRHTCGYVMFLETTFYKQILHDTNKKSSFK